MNLNRRNFAKYLGLAPLAAKAVTDAEISKLAGINSGAPAFQINSGSYGVPPAAGGMDGYHTLKIAASKYVKTVGLPEFVLESMRRNSQYVGSFDADIAAKKSWSMSVKILTQRERNLERQVEALHYRALESQSSQIFKKLTGWDWPW